MLDILPIPIFDDNYVWLSRAGARAFVVDPGDAGPVLAALREHGLTLEAILITHHHPDHIGGVAEIVADTGCPVYGPAHLAVVDRPVGEGSHIALPGTGAAFDVMALPGHTLDHLAYLGGGVLFCGDTLFACGCGRLKEGTPAQMQHSLSRLAELPADTQVYCTHEYTLVNQRFARAVEPGNHALAARAERDAARRAQGLPTVPFGLNEELATNPFLRWAEPGVKAAAQLHGAADVGAVEVFAAIRRWKDGFA